MVRHRQAAETVKCVPIMPEIIMTQTLTAENQDEGVAVPPDGVPAQARS
jgi:hypothetical protein